MYVDVHTHLDHQQFDKDRDQVVENAEKAGVKVIITNGINKSTNRKTLELAEKYSIVKPALGIYPTEILKIEADEYADIESWVPEDFDYEEEIKFIEKNKDRIIAVGEVGMDFYWTDKHNDVQKVLFQKMIDLAKRIDKPIIVHSRKSELECIEMLEAAGMKKVLMHCFGGKLKLAKRIADNGWYLSIPPSVVRSSHFQRIVEEVHLARLLTETDAPYLAPQPDQRNEPAFVTEAVKKIAEIKGMEVKETSEVIFMNYKQLFE